MNQRLLRPRASGFDPRSISGLALWLDAADTQSLYTTDAGPVTPVTAPTEISGCVGWWDASDASSITQSGGLVSQWNDKSGQGNHATASGTARPTLVSNALNGRSVVSFDGADDVMEAAISSGYTAATVFVVLRADAAGGGSLGRVMTRGASTLFFDGANAALRYNPPFAGATGNGGQRTANSSVALGAWSLSSFTWSGGLDVSTAITPRLSGASSSAGLTGTGDSVSSTGISTLAIGNRSVADGNDRGWNGRIAELIFFNASLSTANIARVEAYLAAKWGISGVHAQATATNDPVGYWRDKSGNGGIASQSTGSNRPTRGVINSRSSVTFTAANNTALRTTLNSTIGASKGPYTVVVIGNVTATANDKVLIGSIATGNFDTGVYANSSGGVAGLLVYTTGGILTNVSANSSPVGTPFVAALTKDSAIFEWWGNGARVERRSIGTTNNALSKLLESIGGSLNGSGVIDPVRAYSGNVCEILAYQRVLSSSQIIALSRYASQKWGAPFLSYPLVSNPDAQDWVNRVYQNGGTVSSTTASAVNQFCNDIDGAGIRDRFYRLNLFCGTADASLIAVRTPLYRGQSLGGTQFGSAIDANVNFAITDYAETGASGGLLGDGTSKYLSTGLTPAAIPEIATGHLSAYIPSPTPGSTRSLLGAASGSQQFQLTHRLTGGNQVQVRATWGGTSSSDVTFGAGVTTLPGGLWTITRTSSTALTKYNNATSKATGTTSTTPETHTNGWFVHASNSAGTAVTFANHRILSYSIGASMTAQQVSDYNAAIQAFQTALSRNV
jgi:hypothetical protein